MMSPLLNLSQIEQAIRSVLSDKRDSYGLHEPIFQGNEWDYVKDCIDSGWVSSVGSYVTRFEKMLSEYTGVPFAIAVSNGTAALHIALKLAEVSTKDEVIIPSVTFVATANAVSYCGAIPHLVDSSENTLGIDPNKLKDHLLNITKIHDGQCINKYTGRRIKAVVPMHTFGHPVNLDLLQEVCNEFKLIMVEDAAEGLGSYYRGKHVGHWGELSALSFNGNKTITTGGGGAILTSNEGLAKRAKHITTTAKMPHAWEYVHDEIGYNYRMPNINAALGCAQLEQLDQFVSNKRRLTQKYAKALQGIEGIKLFIEPGHAKSNYWLQTLIIEDKYLNSRDILLQYLNDQGIGARPAWHPMHKLQMYKDCPKMDLTVADRLSRSIINIPSSSNLF